MSILLILHFKSVVPMNSPNNAGAGSPSGRGHANNRYVPTTQNPTGNHAGASSSNASSRDGSKSNFKILYYCNLAQGLATTDKNSTINNINRWVIHTLLLLPINSCTCSSSIQELWPPPMYGINSKVK
jgi:hypothetical protein